jgi:nitrite reductase/ring-hydroxylating ferredoxin subunit
LFQVIISVSGCDIMGNPPHGVARPLTRFQGGKAMEEKGKAKAHGCESCLCGDKTEATRRGFLQFTGGALTAATIAATSLSAAASEKKEEDGGGMGGFFKALFGICKTPELDSGRWNLHENEIRVKVSKVPELQKPYGAVYLQGGRLEVPVLIFRGEDGQVRAYSNKCTHMGRKLDPVPGKEEIRCCSVSHATYDYQGKVTGGPAKEPIKVYEVTSMGDILVIRV